MTVELKVIIAFNCQASLDELMMPLAYAQLSNALSMPGGETTVKWGIERLALGQVRVNVRQRLGLLDSSSDG